MCSISVRWLHKLWDQLSEIQSGRIGGNEKENVKCRSTGRLSGNQEDGRYTEKRIVSDIGEIAHKTMLLIANDGAKSAEEVYLKYGMLVRELVDYMEITVQRVNEMRK